MGIEIYLGQKYYKANTLPNGSTMSWELPKKSPALMSWQLPYLDINHNGSRTQNGEIFFSKTILPMHRWKDNLMLITFSLGTIIQKCCQ